MTTNPEHRVCEGDEILFDGSDPDAYVDVDVSDPARAGHAGHDVSA